MSVPTRVIDPHSRSALLPVLWAGFLTLLIAGPWLAPGYLFGADWPGPRRFDFPSDLSSSAPLEVVLAATSWVIAGEATGKLLVFGSLFVAAVAAYRAVPAGGFVPRAVAATVYLVNPLVYGRLHYGQLFFLAGYAVLPWAALRLRRLLLDPGIVTALVAALGLWLLGALSLHLLVIAGVLAIALLATHLIAADSRWAYVRRSAPALLLTVAVTLGACGYWVVPLLTGSGTQAAALAAFGSGDMAVFAAVPDKSLGLVPNLLGLYGFWAENTGRFTSMKDFVPLWPAILAALLLVCLVGAVAGFRRHDERVAPWVSGLMIAAVIAFLLEMGVSQPLTAGPVNWLAQNLPLYRGMRDAGKWAALLALVYSQLAAFGAIEISDWVHRRSLSAATREWLEGAATALLLAVPLYFGNGLLFGMHGEIKPSQYPAGWYAADQVLSADAHAERALFLPWHAYMPLSFVQNQNPVVAPPAPSFFRTRMLVSTDPEVAGLSPPSDPDQVAISDLVNAGDQGSWAQVLAARNVKYVLLAREGNWSSYAYLDRLPGLVKIGDYGSIVLYRISLIGAQTG